MFRMSCKIYCLQKGKKYIKYKQSKGYKLAINFNEFAKIVDLYDRLMWINSLKNVTNSGKKRIFILD